MDRSRQRIARGLVATLAALHLGALCSWGPAQVVIESPAHGDFVDAASVLVTGRVQNISLGSASLTVNGTPVTIQADKTWSATVPLDAGAVFNPVLAELTNTGTGALYRQRIAIIAGPSVADGALSSQSVALRLNDAGLDQLEPVMASLVDIDLAALLPPGTLLKDDYCVYDTFLGCLHRVDVIVSGSPPPSISSFGIDVDSQVAYAWGDVELQNFFVRTDVIEVSCLFCDNCTIDISAATTDVYGNYALEPLASDPTEIDVTQLGGADVVFTGFNDSTSCGGLLGFFDDLFGFVGLVMGDVQGLVEPEMESFLDTPDASGNTPIAGAVEEALVGIEITGPIGDGLGVSLQAPLFAVNEDTQGIALGSDSSFAANVGTGPGQCDAPPEAPDLPASLASADPFPTFAHCVAGSNPGTACVDDSICAGGGTCQALTPAGALPYGLALGASPAALNQLLKAQTECGLLVQTGANAIRVLEFGGNPMPLTAATLSLFVPQFAVYPGQTPFRIELVPTLAPVITGNPGPQGELGELELAQLAMTIIQDDGTEFVPLAGLVDARLGFELAFDAATGSMLFQFPQPSAQDVAMVITENRVGADAPTLEQYVLPNVLAFILPSLASDLAEFPLPSFMGLQLQGVEVARQGAFLSIFVDLTPAP